MTAPPRQPLPTIIETPKGPALVCKCGWRGGPYVSNGRARTARSQHRCSSHERHLAVLQRILDREAAIDRTPKECTHGGRHKHGTEACYRDDRCRCIPCASARSREAAALRERRRTEGPQHVPAGPARKHVRALMKGGASAVQVARVSGVGLGTIYDMLIGRGTSSPPTERLYRRVSDALRSVTLDEALASVVPTSTVPVIGSRRRVQALVAVGYTYPMIAEAAGLSTKTVYRLATMRDVRYTKQAVVDKIRAAFDTLPGGGPTEFTSPSQARRSEQARARGALLGWAVPAAWNNPDDPREIPRT